MSIDISMMHSRSLDTQQHVSIINVMQSMSLDISMMDNGSLDTPSNGYLWSQKNGYEMLRFIARKTIKKVKKTEENIAIRNKGKNRGPRQGFQISCVID